MSPDWDQPRSGSMVSPFDWLMLEMDVVHAGRVTLSVCRDSVLHQIEVPAGDWHVRFSNQTPHVSSVRPQLSSGNLATYRLGQDALSEGQVQEALAKWQWFAERAEDPRLRHWMRYLVARTLASTEDWEATRVELQKGLAQPLSVAGRVFYLDLLAKAYEYHNQKLEARRTFERIAPLVNGRSTERLSAAWVHQRIGALSYQRGEAQRAEWHFGRAHEIRARLAPGTLLEADSLEGLGHVARARFDLVAAESYKRGAIAIQRAIVPGSVRLSSALESLGRIHKIRKDFRQAERYLHEALTIRQQQLPDSAHHAHTLTEFGRVRLERGAAREAVDHFEKAGRILDDIGSAGLIRVRASHGLGRAHFLLGQKARAVSEYRRALGLLADMGFEGLELAQLLGDMAELEASEGQWAEAEARQRQAIAIIEQQAPQSDTHALLLNRLGTSQRDRGDVHGAAERLQKSIAILEGQIERLGGGRYVRSYYRGLKAWAYHDAVGALVEIGAVDQAFDVLERYRAQELLSLRAETPGPIPPSTPQVLSAEGVSAALDSDTLLISYSVGRDEVFLFVISASGTRVVRLDVTRRSLLSMVEGWTRRVRMRSGCCHDEVSHRSQRLFDVLLKPAEPEFSAATRVVIIPDGPLHRLSFGALQVWNEQAAATEFVVESKECLVSPSATLFVLGRERDAHASPSPTFDLVAFGSVDYGDGTRSWGRSSRPDLEGRTREFDFSQWGALPAVKREMEALQEIYGRQRSRFFLGSDATEEMALAWMGDADIVHFATHGFVDHESPLDSALVLSRPMAVDSLENNGLLEASEVFAEARLRAKLVVLSACQTADGQELGGEGLIGLSQAFLHAGARSVLASLWRVDDEATANLMIEFHGLLHAGLGPPEALQQAQGAMIRGELGTRDTSAPYYWAGFQLIEAGASLP